MATRFDLRAQQDSFTHKEFAEIFNAPENERLPKGTYILDIAGHVDEIKISKILKQWVTKTRLVKTEKEATNGIDSK